jgi:hypothetical protein
MSGDDVLHLRAEDTFAVASGSVAYCAITIARPNRSRSFRTLRLNLYRWILTTLRSRRCLRGASDVTGSFHLLRDPGLGVAQCLLNGDLPR